VEETVNETSIEDQLGKSLTAFGGDMDLDTLLEQADALLDSTPKTETVSNLASFCVWTKSLMRKDVVNRDSTCESIFRRLCTAKRIEDFRFPVSRPDDMSSHPDSHLSTVPSVRTTCSS
jgi:hypothetical protein